jgi:hypothetical protein
MDLRAPRAAPFDLCRIAFWYIRRWMVSRRVALGLLASNRPPDFIALLCLGLEVWLHSLTLGRHRRYILVVPVEPFHPILESVDAKLNAESD